MAKRIGTTKDLIDWNGIIANIIPKSGAYNSPKSVIERAERELNEAPHDDSNIDNLRNEYRTVFKIWKDSGYDFNNIEWWDYYAIPQEHGVIEPNVIDTFSIIVGLKPRTFFISEVMPGQCVPYHWDIEDREAEWLAGGAILERYVCFMQEPKVGHVFIENNDCFYNIPQHEIYQWDHYRDFHAGTNCGLEPYYLFHFLGDRSL